MGRFIVSFIACMGLSGASALAQIAYSPPPVGTQITWSEQATDGTTATRVSQVVASGPDFAIYLFDLGWDETKPVSYFAEFSGLHTVSCVADMPTIDERARLGRLWPLQSGSSLSVGKEQNVTYTVAEPSVHYIVQAEDPRPAQIVHSEVEGFETDITMSLDWKMPVRLAWPDGLSISAIDVFLPSGSRAADTGDEIGQCASLLASGSL